MDTKKVVERKREKIKQINYFPVLPFFAFLAPPPPKLFPSNPGLFFVSFFPFELFFFRRHMGPHPPGLRIYRHFTAVIHRSWIIDDKTAEDKELINLLHCMNGSGGGCTSGIDMKHYALFFKEGRLNTPLAKLAFYICRSSHDYFGVPTFKSLSKFRSEIVQIKQALEG